MCGCENDDAMQVCESCGAKRFAGAGCDLSSFGGDELWDDDQGLMR